MHLSNLKKLPAYCFFVFILTFGLSFSTLASSHKSFSNLISIGDSLSDIGNEADAPYTTENEDHSPGSLWVNFLAQDLKLDAHPSIQGGSIYAYAGAENGALPFNITSDAPTLKDQLDSYFTDVHVEGDSHALYTIWGGGNDLKNAFLGGVSEQDSPQLILASTDHLVNIAKLLHLSGAKTILVANVPNIGETPIAVTLNASLPLSNLATSFNAELLSSLNDSHLNIIQVDTFGLLNAIQSYPEKFGFSGSYSTQHNILNPAGPTEDADTSIFSDGIHPSQNTHKIIADYFLSVLQAPAEASLLAYTPLQIMNAQNELIDSEIWMNFKRKGSYTSKRTWHVFTGFNDKSLHNNASTVLTQSFREYSHTLLIGADYKIDEQDSIGFSLSQSIQDVDAKHDRGDFRVGESIISFFNTHQFLEEGYISHTLGYGHIQESHIHRHFMLGKVFEKVMGDTQGEHYSLKTQGGYDFNFMSPFLKTGPLASLNYQSIHIHSYAEKSSQFQSEDGAFDALRYHHQHLQRLTGQLGWQLHYETSLNDIKISPFVEAKRTHSFWSTSHKVSAGITSLPGSRFTLSTPQFDQDYTLIHTGVQAVFLKDVIVTARYSFRDAHLLTPQGFMLNVSVPLQ